jgi:hypothetical protein
VCTSVASDTTSNSVWSSDKIFSLLSVMRASYSLSAGSKAWIWASISATERPSSVSEMVSTSFWGGGEGGGDGGMIDKIGDMSEIDEQGEDSDWQDSNLESKGFGGLSSSVAGEAGRRGIDGWQPMSGDDHESLTFRVWILLEFSEFVYLLSVRNVLFETIFGWLQLEECAAFQREGDFLDAEAETLRGWHRFFF